MNVIRTVEGTTLISIGVFCFACIVNILIPIVAPSESGNLTAASTREQSTTTTTKRQSSPENVVLVKKAQHVVSNVL